MAQQPGSTLDFLHAPLEPVSPSSMSEGAADVLPQAVADRLLTLPGVDGAWIERDAGGQRFVVLHYSEPGRPAHLPATVEGMPVKVVGGEPIRAG